MSGEFTNCLAAPASLPLAHCCLQVGLKYGLPLLSPVDDGGVFTEEAGPFVGLQVQGDGNEAVIQVGRLPVWMHCSDAGASL